VVSVSLDDSSQQEVGPGLRSALGNFRFIPGLQKGSPTGGQLKLRLADFVQ
jgi:hypothetical protein